MTMGAPLRNFQCKKQTAGAFEDSVCDPHGSIPFPPCLEETNNSTDMPISVLCNCF